MGTEYELGCIYPPAEDSILLLEAARHAEGEVLELCAGSGLAGLSACSTANSVLFVDTNGAALRVIKRAAKERGIKNYSVLKSDLFEELGTRRFDTVLANPPYLPEKAEKEPFHDALVGGKHGYETTLRIIQGLRDHLKPNGRAFLVLSTVYGIDKVYKALADIGFEFEVLGTRKFFFEELILIVIYERRWHSGSERSAYSGGNNKRLRQSSSRQRR